jgi:hypothetical protein
VDKGYQIIELFALDQLVKRTERHEFLVLVLNWLIQQINAVAGDRLRHVEIEVITVTYFGSYPALGVHYKGGDKTDAGPLVESIADELLREKPVIDLIRSVCCGGG